jgi:hypothetical protein
VHLLLATKSTLSKWRVCLAQSKRIDRFWLVRFFNEYDGLWWNDSDFSRFQSPTPSSVLLLSVDPDTSAVILRDCTVEYVHEYEAVTSTLAYVLVPVALSNQPDTIVALCRSCIKPWTRYTAFVRVLSSNGFHGIRKTESFTTNQAGAPGSTSTCLFIR